MNRDELMLEECRAAWRAEARELAKQDLMEKGLDEEGAEDFFEERMAYHYAELEEQLADA